MLSCIKIELLQKILDLRSLNGSDFARKAHLYECTIMNGPKFGPIVNKSKTLKWTAMKVDGHESEMPMK